MRTFTSLAVASAFSLSAHAWASTIISTNLPAGTVIVNIEATTDGAANYSSYDGQPYALWYQPFGVQYTIPAGTYDFQITNAADAANRFPTLNMAQVSQIYAAWTFNSPWLTDYLVFDAAALTDSSRPQLFSGAVESQTYSNGADAYNAAVSAGITDTLHVGAAGRYEGTVTHSYTFAVPTTLVFAIPDGGVGDNSGGVSVIISPVVAPEPASVSLLAAGAVMLIRRRR